MAKTWVGDSDVRWNGILHFATFVTVPPSSKGRQRRGMSAMLAFDK